MRAPSGIAPAVPALVMRADDLQTLALQERDARQHRLPEHRVGLHAAALGSTQRAGFLQDPVGDPDLADVVQQEAVRGARVVCDRHVAHGLRESARIALHALRMRARARVLRLERAGERGDGLHISALQQLALAALELEHVAQVARVQEQRLLRIARALARRTERHAVKTTREPLCDCEQLERAERLAHERVRTDALRFCACSAGRAGEEDDRDVARARIRFELSAELQPGRARHVDVEDDDIGTRCTNAPACGVSAVGFDDLDVRHLERRPQ